MKNKEKIALVDGYQFDTCEDNMHLFLSEVPINDLIFIPNFYFYDTEQHDRMLIGSRKIRGSLCRIIGKGQLDKHGCGDYWIKCEISGRTIRRKGVNIHVISYPEIKTYDPRK